MAGTYDDMPSRKMAWDADGSVVFGCDVANGGGMDRGEIPTGVSLTEMTQVDKEGVNSDDDAQYGSLTGPQNSPATVWAIMFPEKREIDGYYWNVSSTDAPLAVEMLSISKDTTNVRDGVWLPLGQEVINYGVATRPHYRDNIESNADSNVTCVLMQIESGTQISNEWTYLDSLHVYGTITPGQGIDQLIFLDRDSADNEFTKPLDYGDIGRGSASIKSIKVKNNSSTRSASGITITNEYLYLGITAMTYSLNGVDDEATLSIPDLGPGGTVDVYIHINISDSETLGVYEMRSIIEATTWT